MRLIAGRDNELVSYVQKECRGSAVGLAIATGWSLDECESALCALMADTGGTYSISGEGEHAQVEYVFPKDFFYRAMRKRVWWWIHAGIFIPVSEASHMILRATCGITLSFSLGLALAFFGAAVCAIQPQRRRRQPLGALREGIRTWNDISMVYWCLGGQNPFFRPIFFPRPYSILARHYRQGGERWASSTNFNTAKDYMNDDSDQQDAESNNSDTFHHRVVTSFYGFLFGPTSLKPTHEDDQALAWHEMIAFLRRRAFVVVPEELVSWLPYAPPSSLSEARIAAAAVASRFYASPIPVPYLPNTILLHFYKLQNAPQLIGDINTESTHSYLIKPKRNLFPTDMSRYDVYTCTACTFLNLGLWYTLRCFILPTLNSIQTKRNYLPGTQSSPEPDLLLFLITSTPIRLLASYFLAMAIFFLLLPTMRIFIVLIRNVYIDRANATRAALSDELQRKLIQAQSTDALPRTFLFAQQYRRSISSPSVTD